MEAFQQVYFLSLTEELIFILIMLFPGSLLSLKPSACLCWLRESCRHNKTSHKQQTDDLWVVADSDGVDVESWTLICDILTVLNKRQRGRWFPTCWTTSKKIPLSQTVAMHDKRPAELNRWSGFSLRQYPAVRCFALSRLFSLIIHVCPVLVDI